MQTREMFALHIAQILQADELTCDELATELELPLSSVRGWLERSQSPTLEELAILADFTGFAISYFTRHPWKPTHAFVPFGCQQPVLTFRVGHHLLTKEEYCLGHPPHCLKTIHGIVVDRKDGLIGALHQLAGGSRPLEVG